MSYWLFVATELGSEASVTVSGTPNTSATNAYPRPDATESVVLFATVTGELESVPDPSVFVYEIVPDCDTIVFLSAADAETTTGLPATTGIRDISQAATCRQPEPRTDSPRKPRRPQRTAASWPGERTLSVMTRQSASPNQPRSAQRRFRTAGRTAATTTGTRGLACHQPRAERTP